jgi:hypothetical protein
MSDAKADDTRTTAVGCAPGCCHPGATGTAATTIEARKPGGADRPEGASASCPAAAVLREVLMTVGCLRHDRRPGRRGDAPPTAAGVAR